MEPTRLVPSTQNTVARFCPEPVRSNLHYHRQTDYILITYYNAVETRNICAFPANILGVLVSSLHAVCPAQLALFESITQKSAY